MCWYAAQEHSYAQGLVAQSNSDQHLNEFRKPSAASPCTLWHCCLLRPRYRRHGDGRRAKAAPANQRSVKAADQTDWNRRPYSALCWVQPTHLLATNKWGQRGFNSFHLHLCLAFICIATMRPGAVELPPNEPLARRLCQTCVGFESSCSISEGIFRIGGEKAWSLHCTRRHFCPSSCCIRSSPRFAVILTSTLSFSHALFLLFYRLRFRGCSLDTLFVIALADSHFGACRKSWRHLRAQPPPWALPSALSSFSPLSSP